AAEREVFQQLTINASLVAVLESITRLVESICREATGSISVLAEAGESFQYIVAPQLPERLRAVLARSAIDIRNGSCAAAVYLGRQVLVADLTKDPYWQQRRQVAQDSGLRAAWSVPIKSANGKILGALGVYRREVGLPSSAEVDGMAHAAQL